MKAKYFLLAVLIISQAFATNEWRVFGPGPVVKSSGSSPPFLKWHNYTIGYEIHSAPSQPGCVWELNGCPP